MHLLGVWDGTPIVVADSPELANHWRQPKTFKLWGKSRNSAGMAGVGVPMGPLQQHLALDPVQRSWWCLPVGVTWGPPHLPLPI